jgi:transcriptional antiterminator NusG
MTTEDEPLPTPDAEPAAAAETLPPEPEEAAEAEPVDEPESAGDDAPAEVDEPESAGDDAPAEVEVTEPTAAAAEPAAEPAAPAAPPTNKKWYIVKVTSGREESIKAAIERRVKIEGLEEFFGQVYIPVEKVVEVKKVKETKNGEKVTKERRVTKERKKFPGYIMAEVEFNDRILYLFRETSGVGDFVGGSGPMKPPPPMTEIEVKRMLGDIVPDDKDGKGRKVKVKLDFEKGDKVRIREGAFANMEGEVKEITEPKEAGETPKVTVEVPIFGRPVPVDLEYWQVDKI